MASEAKLSGEEIALLRLAETLGGEIDLSGPRIQRKTKDIALGLLRAGYFGGRTGKLLLTETALAALAKASTS